MLTLSLFSLAVAAFSVLRLRTYLLYFQQEEYNAPRFLVWWWQARALDRWASLGLIIALPFAFWQPAVIWLNGAFWLAYRAKIEPNPTRTGKKPLVLTQRARSIWALGSLLAVALHGVWLWLVLPAQLNHLGTNLCVLAGSLLLLQTLPLALVLANFLLLPYQHLQNQKFLRQAHALLTRLNPTVISLSGAFGKTSTKYFLGHILAGHAPTLMSPGSTNTPLGLARIINEQLQAQHQFFLAEMGAYQVGSIAAICRLVPPHFCGTTAIGPAHYERFKSVAAVAQAEFEVIDATLARPGGIAVLSIDCIPDDLWQPRYQANPAQIRLVTARPTLARPDDFLLTELAELPTGVSFKLTHQGQTVAVQAPLLGRTQIFNLGTALALAKLAGVPLATAAAALRTVQAAPHRLNLRQEGTQTVLDDSYNSNPEGFKTALQALSQVAAGTRRRVLITPGLVELGALHASAHTTAGQQAAENSDITLVVNPTRIPTFVSAFQQAARQQPTQPQLVTVPTLAAARQWLKTHGQPHDVILLANDLPDRYEARWTL